MRTYWMATVLFTALVAITAGAEYARDGGGFLARAVGQLVALVLCVLVRIVNQAPLVRAEDRTMIKARLTSFAVNGEEIVQHLAPKIEHAGLDLASGQDQTVHVRFTPTSSWSAWWDEDGRLIRRYYWSRAKHRRDTKRFIREEVARRRLERRMP